MPKGGPIPSKDADFNDYVVNAVPYLNANKTRLGVSTANMTELQSLFTQWNTVYPKSQNRDLRTRAITAQKKQLRLQMSALLRKIYRDIPQSALTVSDRETLGLKLRDIEPTPVAIVAYAPTIALDTMRHLLHTLRIADPTNPLTRAMPKGHKAEVQWFVGNAGLSTDKITFDRSDTATRFLFKVAFGADDVGKTAYYRACYRNTRGQRGPWSAVISAVVG